MVNKSSKLTLVVATSMTNCNLSLLYKNTTTNLIIRNNQSPKTPALRKTNLLYLFICNDGDCELHKNSTYIVQLPQPSPSTHHAQIQWRAQTTNLRYPQNYNEPGYHSEQYKNIAHWKQYISSLDPRTPPETQITTLQQQATNINPP